MAYSRSKTWSSPPKTRFAYSKSFGLTLVSVDNLQCHRLIGKEIRVYAEVQLDHGAVRTTEKYVADGPNLTLNFPVDYPISNEAGGNLVVRLYYDRSMHRRTCIGVANIDITRLFNGWRERHSDQNITDTYQLTKGDLTISYRFD